MKNNYNLNFIFRLNINNVYMTRLDINCVR